MKCSTPILGFWGPLEDVSETLRTRGVAKSAGRLSFLGLSNRHVSYSQNS